MGSQTSQKSFHLRQVSTWPTSIIWSTLSIRLVRMHHSLKAFDLLDQFSSVIYSTPLTHFWSDDWLIWRDGADPSEPTVTMRPTRWPGSNLRLNLTDSILTQYDRLTRLSIDQLWSCRSKVCCVVWVKLSSRRPATGKQVRELRQRVLHFLTSKSDVFVSAPLANSNRGIRVALPDIEKRLSLP